MSLYVSTWYGFWFPRATPKDVIAKLNVSVMDALADPTVRKRFAPRWSWEPRLPTPHAQHLAAEAGWLKL
jgi:tripartite-type tricarboxylate transporter receptor subunit TctC